MSMPTIPNINPSIDVTRDDALNIILSSIGMEELSLAHIVNAEAEKIQFALGTLETAEGAASIEQIMEVNTSAKKMLRDVIKNQMLIGMKMEDTMELALQVRAEQAAVVEPEPTPEPEPEVAEEEPVEA
ncbi:MAG: hypothetical protein R3Y58_06895 [Eubacteriales bacterium]